MTALDLKSTYLRLRPDASIERLPVDETFWPRIMSGALGSFHNEFLVICHGSEADWTSWERHPNGDEIVCLLTGHATLILETGQGNVPIELTGTGSFAFVPQGTWHTAKIHRPSTMLFITAGEGTEHRPA